ARAAARAAGSCYRAGAAGGPRPDREVCSVLALPWRAPMSPRVRAGENETAVHERGAAQLPTLVREPQPALEPPVRDFQTMDGGAVHAGGQLPYAGDAQHAALDRDLDLLGFDAGQCRDDGQFLLALVHIDRGLPIDPRARRQPGLEKAAVQLLRPLDHRAGFGPHPVSRIGCAHGTCPSRNRVISSKSSHPSLLAQVFALVRPSRDGESRDRSAAGSDYRVRSRVSPPPERRLTPCRPALDIGTQ